MVSTWDLAQIRTIAEASARIIQNDGRTQDARVLREVVARFDQVAGPLEDHYGQVEQWKTLILGRPEIGGRWSRIRRGAGTAPRCR